MADIENNESHAEAVRRSQGEHALESAQNLVLNTGMTQGLAEALATALEIDGEVAGGLTVEDGSVSIGDLGDARTNVSWLREYTSGIPNIQAERLMERFIGRVKQGRQQQGS